MIPISALMAGRRDVVPFDGAANSSLLVASGDALLATRTAPLALTSDARETLTFAAWIAYDAAPGVAGYVLFSADDDAGNSITISIDPLSRLKVSITQTALAAAEFYCPIGTLPPDGVYRHICVAVDTGTAQANRRVTFAIDGYDRTPSAFNPPPQNQNLVSISANKNVYLLGVVAPASRFVGEMALTYVLFGRALASSQFIFGRGLGITAAKPFPAAILPGDLYVPFISDTLDAWNGNIFTGL